MKDKDNFKSTCWFGCSSCIDCKYMKVDSKYSTYCAKGKTLQDKKSLFEKLFKRNRKV